jgi:hypothetical protein
MEVLAAIGLVGNIVQFVDFSCKLISGSVRLYGSVEGALVENSEIEAVARDVVLLHEKLKGGTTSTSNAAIKSICQSCNNVSDELLDALHTLKVKGKYQRWTSLRKAFRSIWSKEKIEELERRLARLRERLNLRIIAELRCVPTQSPVSDAGDTCISAGSKSLKLN